MGNQGVGKMRKEEREKNKFHDKQAETP